MTRALQKESFESRLWRWGGNLFPAYRSTGARVVYVSPDFHEVHIKIPSSWRTRNHMGITWGGGLYGALDPIFGVMLFKILGYRYRVIDKRADIRFKKPATGTLFARFKLSQRDVDSIRSELALRSKAERSYEVELRDKEGRVHAACLKTLCIFN